MCGLEIREQGFTYTLPNAVECIGVLYEDHDPLSESNREKREHT